MKFSAYKYNISASFQIGQKREYRKVGNIFLHCIFLTRMGEVGCLQAFQTAADRSLTIVMTQTKGTHGFQLALFIVCSNGDCSVNIYLAKNASWCSALNPQQRETAITMMKFYQLRCNFWLCCYSSADFPIATRQCHDSKKKKNRHKMRN